MHGDGGFDQPCHAMGIISTSCKLSRLEVPRLGSRANTSSFYVRDDGKDEMEDR